MKGRTAIKAVIAVLCICAAGSFTLCGAVKGESFGAYYTRLPMINDDPLDKVGQFADVVVRIDATRSFIFCRDTSYLPRWESAGRSGLLPEVIERAGDGEAQRPDRINRYSYVRIIQNSPEQIVVHWRYIPDFSKVGWDGVVDEYYTIRPDGSMIRTIRPGTETHRAWELGVGRRIQQLKLGQNGLDVLSSKEQEAVLPPRPPIAGRSVTEVEVGDVLLNFRFDEALAPHGNTVVESVSGHRYSVAGPGAIWRNGISGTSLLFDGYATAVSLPQDQAPEVSGSLTVEAWVALGAYPFNWAPFVQQAEWGQSGYYFGVNELGQLGFSAAVGGEWVTLQASSGTFDTDLQLFRWHHVAATFDGEWMRLFLDGKLVASREVAGRILPADCELTVGLNRDRFKPTSEVRDWATYPSLFGIDGLMDEVRIHHRALPPGQLAAIAGGPNLDEAELSNPDLEARGFPAPPTGKPSAAFGARYENLPYHAGFDHFWRVGDHPDIVVDFDQNPCRLVFWKGLRYAPAMVTENGKWSGDQSAETGGIWDKQLPFDHPEAVGCAEHMSDAQARHSHVQIIEDTPARVVVHWRYAEIDVRYKLAKDDDGWGAWADEYYSIYPDGTAIRHVARYTGGWQETLFYNAPGTRPEDNVEMEAYTLVNADGAKKTYSWATSPDPYPEIPGDLDLSGGPFVSMINFKSKWRPYYIYAGGRVGTFNGEVREEFSRFPWWNHYPVSQAISDGRRAERPDRMTHSSLVWGRPEGDYLMVGLTDRAAEDLLPLARSWRQAPQLEMVSGGQSHGYRMQCRDYLLRAEGDELRFKLNASKTSPVQNLCFTVRQWDGRGEAKVTVNGKPARDLRQGTFIDTDGTRTLVLFMECQTTQKTEISIHAES